jgi:hypothetical protein
MTRAKPTTKTTGSTAVSLYLDEPDLIAWASLNQPVGYSLGEAVRAFAVAQATAELDGIELAAGSLPPDLVAALTDLRRILDRLGIAP